LNSTSRQLRLKGEDNIVAVVHIEIEDSFSFQVFMIENHGDPRFPDRPSTSLYYRRFLDISASILDPTRSPHGIIGQTARIDPNINNQERSTKKWSFQGVESNYELKDGLKGKRFSFNKFR